MILVVGGTSEGRAIAGKLKAGGARVLVSTATAYGADLAAGDGVEVIQGRINLKEMAALLTARKIKVLVDASHPFATGVSENAAGACSLTGVSYIRFARPGGGLPDSPMVITADSYEQSALLACGLGRTVFLATGSKTAGLYLKAAGERGNRVVIRVIPDPDVIRGLLDMGFSPSDVVAMRGPFSREMNTALLKYYNADVMVTKESGQAGGLSEKIDAAAGLGIPLVVVKRPPEPFGAVDSVDAAVNEAIKLSY